MIYRDGTGDTAMRAPRAPLRKPDTSLRRDSMDENGADAKGKDAPFPEMIRIPGGTFRMGSDRHYVEEAPVHRVTVDEFWVDRTPVTNRQFKAFVRATGHVTFAEIVPNAEDYPRALPHMLFAGSTVFSPPGHVVDLRDWTIAGALVVISSSVFYFMISDTTPSKGGLRRREVRKR